VLKHFIGRMAKAITATRSAILIVRVTLSHVPKINHAQIAWGTTKGSRNVRCCKFLDAQLTTGTP
jgi:hypothetical protein